jgi:hypothetical protein
VICIITLMPLEYIILMIAALKTVWCTEAGHELNLVCSPVRD